MFCLNFRFDVLHIILLTSCWPFRSLPQSFTFLGGCIMRLYFQFWSYSITMN